MNISLFAVLILVAFASVAHGFSTGAPNAACDTVSPNPVSHGAPPSNTPSPYNVSLPLGYVPGDSYMLTFSGSQLFRGMLVVSETSPGTRVGTFSPIGASQLTCSDNRGITHTSAADKSSLSFMWTAPASGSGPVTFRYAGVQIRTIYWANQIAGIVQELPAVSTPPPSIAPTTTAENIPSTSATLSPSPSATPIPGNCTGVYCNRYQRLNPYTCACECPNYCNGSLYQDSYTCECKCPHLRTETTWLYQARSCARYYNGATFNPVTCGCDCVQLNDCSYDQYFSRSSCSCECNSYYSCSEGMYFNTDRCRCECSNRYCAPGFYLNPSSCECECNRRCGYDEDLDYYTCQCRRKSQYPDVQCSSLQYLYTCLNAESLFGISCLWRNEQCITECCSPKPSRNPHFGYKLCPQLATDYYRCSKSNYCNWRCGGHDP